MAERTFTLEIVTPDRMLLSDDGVVSLVVPGAEGYLGILADHAPLMTELTIGEVTVRRADGREAHMAASKGFMEVADNKVTILADSAEKAEEIDMERAKEALRRAEERLARAEDTVDLLRAEISMKRALNRLRVAQRVM
jgi:F-type H+-transporting ATPase subunit epsilon